MGHLCRERGLCALASGFKLMEQDCSTSGHRIRGLITALNAVIRRSAIAANHAVFCGICLSRGESAGGTHQFVWRGIRTPADILA